MGEGLAGIVFRVTTMELARASLHGDKEMNAPVWTPPARYDEVPTLADFAQTWQLEQSPSWKPSHARTVREGLAFWVLPSLGACKIDDITRADLLAFRAWMHGHERKPSVPRVNKIMNMLWALLREGVQRFDFTDPTEGLKQLPVQLPDVAPFTMNEVTRILAALAQPWRDYFALRFFTGLRTGEVDGLRWDCVDLQNRRIFVRRTWVDGAWETPKTRAGVRDVHLIAPAVEALRVQFTRTGHAGQLVFATRRGTPVVRRNITRRVWYPVLDQLGLARRRAYQTRHTYATLMLAAGESVEFIRAQLGHRDTQMLFTRYSRFVPNLTRQDGSAFDALVART